MSVFWEALALVAEPGTLGAILVASLLGITLGAIPGLTAVMGVALLVASEKAIAGVQVVLYPGTVRPPRRGLRYQVRSWWDGRYVRVWAWRHSWVGVAPSWIV